MNIIHKGTTAQTIGIICFSLASGCAWIQGAPPSEIAEPLIVDSTPVVADQNEAPLTEVTETPTVAVEPVPDAAYQSMLTDDKTIGHEQQPPANNQSIVKKVEPSLVVEQPQVKGTPPIIVKTVEPPLVIEQPRVKEIPPVIVKIVESPLVVEQPQVKETPAVIVKTVEPALIVEQAQVKEVPPAIVKAVEPPLDVASLQTRLRDTKAIGLFTKIALKNQVDDLLKQFKAHYQNGQKASITSLRQPYDMLVLKVLALIQDEDPSLAKTISGSREAIWSILADQEKFNLAT